jgi:hypothetical protein
MPRSPDPQIYPLFPMHYLTSCSTNYLLTRCGKVLLEKLTGMQPVKKFPAFYGTRTFITAFTSVPPTVSIQSQLNPVHTPTTHFLTIHLHIILPSTSGSPLWFLSLRFPHQNPVHASPLLHPRHMHRPSHFSGFYHPHNIELGVQIMKLFIMKFSPPPFITNTRTKPVSIHTFTWRVRIVVAIAALELKMFYLPSSICLHGNTICTCTTQNYADARTHTNFAQQYASGKADSSSGSQQIPCINPLLQLPFSQQPATCPYPEPNRSSTCPVNRFVLPSHGYRNVD